ncbi:MAG: caspase family protein [Planctomycetia bacterium]|nr:caspase family protein [Planctomycetia bacterium]
MKKSFSFFTACVFVVSCFLVTFTGNVDAEESRSYYQSGSRPALANPPGVNVRKSSNGVQSRVDTCAILFAIDDYSGTGLESLNGCCNDARRMQKWLTEHDVRSANISLLMNENATDTNFYKALDWAKSANCQRLIVVIACHGGAIGGKSFFCPRNMVDMKFDRGTDVDALQMIQEKRLISLSYLLQKLREVYAKEVLLVLDACRNVQVGGGETDGFMHEFRSLMGNKNNFAKYNSSFAVITSCSFGQQAAEIEHDGNSYGKFLHYFMDGLDGKADFSGCYDNRVTLTEAYNYAYAQMGEEQTPEIFTATSGGNMVLASYADIPRPKNLEEESDLAFLLRTGVLLSNMERWSVATNQKGVKALDCVLENIPNHKLACSVRGGVHRRTGNYTQALLDWGRVGMKMQVYAGKMQETVRTDTYGRRSVRQNIQTKTVMLLDSPDGGAKSVGMPIEAKALLTVEGINGDYLLISEVNNQAITPGWIHQENVFWSNSEASNVITATRAQASRSYNAATSGFAGGGVAPGGRVGMPGGGPISALP